MQGKEQTFPVVNSKNELLQAAGHTCNAHLYWGWMTYCQLLKSMTLTFVVVWQVKLRLLDFMTSNQYITN